MQENNRDFSLLKRNIFKYLDFKGETKANFYINTGISSGVLSQKNGLSEENIMRFLTFYTDVNPGWLITGDGPMIKVENPKEQSQLVKTDIPIYIKELLLIKDNTISELNREIGRLQAKIELLDKKDKGYLMAAEPQIEFKKKK